LPVAKGEYEGLARKSLQKNGNPDWPFRLNDSGCPSEQPPEQEFLIAYNVNLNTTSIRRANAIAFDIREKGRVKREGDPVNGRIITDAHGEPEYEPGLLKAVKAIGWYIEEYGIAQISINLTDLSITPLHIAFDATCEQAEKRGLRVTGSEIIGVVPLGAMLEAGKYFLEKQNRSTGIPEKEIIKLLLSFGLGDLVPLYPEKKIENTSSGHLEKAADELGCLCR
jgi:glutamate formiminotransferase/formiminotetrahydrofolate cyclodeaminase